MTSASGDILTKVWVLPGAGVKEVTLMFAVAVEVRCSVSGCEGPAEGFGNALTCERKLVSRKRA